jgi:hypothetical protein
MAQSADSGATNVLLDFDAIGDAMLVNDQYHAAYGVDFSHSAISLIGRFAGGCCGNFAGQPSGSSAMTILKSDRTYMDIEGERSIANVFVITANCGV